MNPGRLYVVATPIGNLKDITFRAFETLKEVDLILAEDTRVSRKLLAHLHIVKPIERLDQHVSETRIEAFVSKLEAGHDLALITDAGTPNVSDPGWRLVRRAAERGIETVPIPGPSALTALVSISHFPMSEFVFVGFPPSKKGRRNFFETIAKEPRPVVLYESTHRILKTIEELSASVPQREAVVAKELTKIHERIWRGEIGDLAAQFKELTKEELKGEFVVGLAYDKK